MDMNTLDILYNIKLEGSGCTGDVYLKSNKLFCTPIYNKLIEIDLEKLKEQGEKEILVPKVITRDIIKENKLDYMVN